MVEWLIDNWLKITIPVLAFLACYIVGLWVRRVVSNAFERWESRIRWQGSKLVMTGDIQQLDSPFLDATSNGLSRIVEKFKAQEISAHVTLVRGERSELATLAAELL